jgi:DnaJ-class molecular chaperone
MTARSSLSIREAADILGIANHASINDIRSRYHALVKEWHPDVSRYDSEDTHAKMVRLNEAYDIIIGYCLQ